MLTVYESGEIILEAGNSETRFSTAATSEYECSLLAQVGSLSILMREIRYLFRPIILVVECPQSVTISTDKFQQFLDVSVQGGHIISGHRLVFRYKLVHIYQYEPDFAAEFSMSISQL